MRLDLTAIQARADSSHAGPWEVDGLQDVVARHDTRGIAWGVARQCDPRDVKFIAHARTDVPALLDRVRQIEADLADAHRDALVNRDTANRAEATIERVRLLHRRVYWDNGILVCDHCRSLEWQFSDAAEDRVSEAVKWPCATTAALDAGEGQ